MDAPLAGNQFLKALIVDIDSKAVGSIALLEKVPAEHRELLGVALLEMYRLSTCFYGCRGDGHIMESFIGRGYNQSVAAVHLISLGFYDEAMALTRGVGEITNLITLMLLEFPKNFREWVEADRSHRMRHFGPKSVRQKLTSLGHPALPMGDDEYAELSERFVHLNPGTVPNSHDVPRQGFIGGPIQEQGFTTSYDMLSTEVVALALTAAKALSNEDVLNRVVAIVRDCGK
ncbi:MAG: hypothetical protein WAU70_17405 [Flavobacteriales bacterium]